MPVPVPCMYTGRGCDETIGSSPATMAEEQKPLTVLDTERNSNRCEHTTACLPIVRGSVAWYLGKKADEYQTHEWTLFLRGANNEDLSAVIEKVVFTLHSSFAQPIREFTQPPFEVTEKGWGEFEAQIKIFWQDPNESATVVSQSIDRDLLLPNLIPFSCLCLR